MNRRNAVKAVAAPRASLTARPAAVRAPCCHIVELRQYAMRPGKRDVMIDLFEREFIESQEAAGITVIGQFRDLDDPNRYVWLRGFPDMPSRKKSLEAFYHGAHWKSLRDSANATLVDNDNVLLLHPVRADSGFVVDQIRRPSLGAPNGQGLVVATICYFDGPVTEDFVDFFDRSIKSELIATKATVLACLSSSNTANTFPALPIRDREHAFVWFSAFESADSYDAHRALLAQSETWSELSRKLTRLLNFRAPEVLRLSPTARSLLRV
jgi:quinol monooxygenase YgiN